jgi:hypothetical protein
MGNAVSWIDNGDGTLDVRMTVPRRRNGLPNFAAVQAVSTVLENFRPEAYDPIEPVPESVAKAAMRDNVVSHVEISADHPPVPVFDDDEMPGPRCQSGVCLGD